MVIIFSWVPEHMGFPGNEKTGVASKRELNSLHHLIPYTHVKYLIERFIRNKWHES